MRELAFFLLVTALCGCIDGQTVHCCSPLLDVQMVVNAYIGLVDINQLPNSVPEAYTGSIRVTKKTSASVEKSEYVDFDLPGFAGLTAVIGDFSNQPASAVFYDLYENGSCIYTEYEGVFMTPPCVPGFWPKLESYYLGSDILVDKYGDDEANNYLIVKSAECEPLIHLATRRNAPNEGLYRFNTEMYTNATAFEGEVEIPDREHCSPGGATYKRPPVPQPYGSPFLEKETL